MYLISKCNLLDFTQGYNNGPITGFTLESGAFWLPVKLLRNLSTVGQAIAGSTGAVTQTATIQFATLSDNPDKEVAAQEAANFVNDLINDDNGVVMVFTDNAGVRRALGLTTGLYVADSDGYVSGATFTDVSSYTIVLEGPSTEMALAIEDTVTLPTS